MISDVQNFPLIYVGLIIGEPQKAVIFAIFLVFSGETNLPLSRQPNVTPDRLSLTDLNLAVLTSRRHRVGVSCYKKLLSRRQRSVRQLGFAF